MQSDTLIKTFNNIDQIDEYPDTSFEDNSTTNHPSTLSLHHEHILADPQTYIGSIREKSRNLWIMDQEKKIFINKEIKYIEGLNKIFVEIITNACEHSERDMTCRNIYINVSKYEISVYNDGNNGVPVKIIENKNKFLPEILFGDLAHEYLQSNGNGTQKCGKHVILANIFSTEFHVSIADMENRLLFSQIFYNNMRTLCKPIIEEMLSDVKSFIKITFKPDFKFFGINCLSDDMINLFFKKTYYVSAITRPAVDVYLNNVLVPVKSLSDYKKLFCNDDNIGTIKNHMELIKRDINTLENKFNNVMHSIEEIKRCIIKIKSDIGEL